MGVVVGELGVSYGAVVKRAGLACGYGGGRRACGKQRAQLLPDESDGPWKGSSLGRLEFGGPSTR